VYPFLYDSLDLNVRNVGFIIIQVKNDSNLTRSEGVNLFRKMDPFKCGLLNKSDKENGQFPIPLIHIVFSLAGTTDPHLARVVYKEPSDGAETLGTDGRLLFTSYDYICLGMSETILQPVKDSQGAWEALANARDQWKDFYDVPMPSVLRSQLSGCREDEAHFGSWLGATVFPSS
jgi:hypothetical protein